jgi:hypothetical protein
LIDRTISVLNFHGDVHGPVHDNIKSVTASGGTLYFGGASDAQGVNANASWKVESGALLEVHDSNLAIITGDRTLEN